MKSSVKYILIFHFLIFHLCVNAQFNENENLRKQTVYKIIKKPTQKSTYNNTANMGTIHQNTIYKSNQTINNKSENITYNVYYYTTKENEKEINEDLKYGTLEFFEKQIYDAELAIDKIILSNYDSLQNANFEKSLELINKNIFILKKRKRDNLEKAFAYSEKAKIFSKEKLRDSTINSIKISENFINETKHPDNKKLGLVLFNLANNYFMLDSIGKANELNKKSLKLNETFLPESDSIFTRQYWLQSVIYSKKQQYELSLENINKSLNSIKLRNEKAFFTLKHRSATLFKLNRYEESLEDAIAFRNKIATKTDSLYLAEIDNLINLNLLNLNRHSEIANYIFEEKKLNELSKNENALLGTYFILGKYYNQQKETDSAIFYFEKIIDIRHKIRNYNFGRTIIDDYVSLFEIYLSKKDFVSAENTFDEIKNNDFDIEINKDWLFEAEKRLLFEKIGFSDVEELLFEHKYNDVIEILENKTFFLEENTIDSSLQNIMELVVYSLLAVCYSETNKLQSGQIYLNKSLKLLQQINKNENNNSYNSFLFGISSLQYKIHNRLNQPDSAINVLKKMIPIWGEKFEENYEYISGTYQMISNIYAKDLDNLDSAIYYITKSIEIDIEVDDFSNSLFKERLMQRAEFYMKLKNYSKALKDLEFSSEIYLKNHSLVPYYNEENNKHLIVINQSYSKLRLKEEYLKAECYYYLNHISKFNAFFGSKFDFYFDILYNEEPIIYNAENNFGLGKPDNENNFLDSTTTGFIFDSGTIPSDKPFNFYTNSLPNGFKKPFKNLRKIQFKTDTVSISQNYLNDSLYLDSTLIIGKWGTMISQDEFIANLDSIQFEFLLKIAKQSLFNNDLKLAEKCLELIVRFTAIESDLTIAKFYYLSKNNESAIFHINRYLSLNSLSKKYLIKTFPLLKKEKKFKELVKNLN